MKKDNGVWTDRAGRRLLLAAILAVGLIALTHLMCNVSYLNNDDTNIFYALAGYRTGTPYPAHRFIHAALGAFISGLYTLWAAIPWWTVYHLAALALSLTVIFACLLKLCQAKSLPIWVGPAACVFLYLGIFIYPVVTMTFTLTACLLGTAGVMLVLAYDDEHDGKGKRAGIFSASLLFMALAFFTRNSAGMSMLCFWGAAVFYRFLCCRRFKKRLLSLILYALAGAALFVGCVVSNTASVKALNPADYPAFEEARGRFTDYPHVTYEENPAFFQELGWDDTVYALADNLCFLDEDINAETMAAVMDGPGDDQASLPSRLISTLEEGIAFFRGSGIAQYMVAVPGLLTILAVAFFMSRRKTNRAVENGAPALVAGLCTALGAFALCFYLLLMGRFPVRTFQLIAIPTGTLLAGFCIRLYSPMDLKKTGTLALITLSAAIASWSLSQTVLTELKYDKRDLEAESAAAEAYCISHPENVYLTDVTSIENIGAFTVYPEEKPVNLVDWGGTGMHSGWKEEQLALNGLLPFNGSVFQRENVLFLTEEDGDKLKIIYAYLARHWGATGYEIVGDVTGNLVAYRFLFSEETP